MRLVEGLVDERVVQAAVDEVDEAVGEEDEEGELDVVVEGEGLVRGVVVEFRVAAHFGEEEGDGEHRHVWHGCHGLLDLHANLVLEEFRVLEGCLVEDEVVGKGGDDAVEQCAGEPGNMSDKEAERSLAAIPHDEEQRDQLSIYIISRQLAHVCCLSRREGDERTRGLELPWRG